MCVCASIDIFDSVQHHPQERPEIQKGQCFFVAAAARLLSKRAFAFVYLPSLLLAVHRRVQCSFVFSIDDESDRAIFHGVVKQTHTHTPLPWCRSSDIESMEKGEHHKEISFYERYQYACFINFLV